MTPLLERGVARRRRDGVSDMNIGIIGLGLIGGSLGKAITKKTTHKVYGFDISPDVLMKAELLSAIHSPLIDYKTLDLLIIAVNPRAFEKILLDVAPKLKSGACIIDICGNKSAPVEAMREISKQHPDIHFVGTHPMAGKEVSGIKHSSASLFDKASMIFVPVTKDIETIANLKKLFLDLGFGEVVITDEVKHDRLIAYTSQLPHIISSCYIQSDLAENHRGFSAGSFRDLSRVAKMNPGMWTELVFDNRAEVLPELESFIDRMSEFKDALVAGDEGKIKEMFEKGDLKKREIK